MGLKKKKKEKVVDKEFEMKQNFIGKDFLCIEDINEGVLKRDGYYTSFVLIDGINFDLLGDDDKTMIMDKLGSIVNTFPYHQSWLGVNESIDTTKYRNFIQDIQKDIDPLDEAENERYALTDDYNNISVYLSKNNYTQRFHYMAFSAKISDVDISTFLREINLVIDDLQSAGLVPTNRKKIATGKIIKLLHNLLFPMETNTYDIKMGG